MYYFLCYQIGVHELSIIPVSMGGNEHKSEDHPGALQASKVALALNVNEPFSTSVNILGAEADCKHSEFKPSKPRRITRFFWVKDKIIGKR